jgi:hypothetical protein
MNFVIIFYIILSSIPPSTLIQYQADSYENSLKALDESKIKSTGNHTNPIDQEHLKPSNQSSFLSVARLSHHARSSSASPK